MHMHGDAARALQRSYLKRFSKYRNALCKSIKQSVEINNQFWWEMFQLSVLHTAFILFRHLKVTNIITVVSVG